MIKKIHYLSLILILITSSLKSQDYYSDQLFIKVNNFEIDLSKQTEVEKILKPYSVEYIKRAFKLKEMRNVFIVKFKKEPNDLDAIIHEFKKLSYVDYAEKIPIYKLFFTPNDLLLNQHWNLDKIQADLAWNLCLGCATVKVAVTDDGFLMNHEDLTNKWYINPGEIAGNNIDDDANGFVDDWRGWDAADVDNDPSAVSPTNSVWTHGTHVAGIVAAETNNSKGIASIGYNTLIIPVKNTNSSSFITHGYQSIEYAIIAGADVINMSWGGGAYSTTYQTLFNTAYSKGIMCVAAAGNSNTFAPMYPASYNHVISVASTNGSDYKSGFSNFGTSVDVSAPGSNIFSTLAGSTTSYGTFSGTSMASPLVAGLCALMKCYNPMHIDSIEDCLKRGSDNIDTLNVGFVGSLGAGRINAYKSLQCLTKKPISNFLTSDSFVCIGAPITYYATSIGAPVLTYKWSFPGGTPPFSTLKNPSVTYSTSGFKSATLITTNSIGSDTITKSNIVEIDTPKAWLNGKKYTIFGSYPAIISISFKGKAPYSVTLTDGVKLIPITNITQNPFFYHYTPTKDTTILSISSFSDNNCIGKKFGIDTIYKTKLIGLDTLCDTSKLLACYPFTGNANDEYGTNHATVFGPTLTTDRFGTPNSAYYFDGIDDSMIVNNTLGNFGTSDYSISYWIQLNSNDVLSRYIVSKRNYCSNDFYWSAGVSGGKVGFEINEGLPSNYLPTQAPTLINDGSWHFIVHTRSGKKTFVYVDGILRKSDSLNIIVNSNNNSVLKIGTSVCAGLGGTNRFKGKLDDIKFYKRTLKNNELLGLCNCNTISISECDTGNLSVGLLAYYKLDGNTLDASGNNNHGTQVGGVSYIPGKKNQAASFDGVDDYIALNKKIFDSKTDFSISGWVYLNQNVTPSYQFNIYRENNHGWWGKGLDISYGYFGTNQNDFHATWCHGTSAGMITQVALDTVPAFNWACFAVTRKNDSLKLYIDGELKSTVYNQYIDSGNNNGILGGWYFNNDPNQSGFVKGYLDEIRMYDRELSPSEIMAVCDKCNPIVFTCDSLYNGMKIFEKDTLLICKFDSLTLKMNPNLQNYTKSVTWNTKKYFLDSSISFNPIIKTDSNIKYKVNLIATGCNLITNPNFESGNTGFTSDYTFTSSNSTSGEYNVTNSTISWNPWGSSCFDHTTGSGNMLMLNGFTLPNKNLWSQTLNVQANTDYRFSYWIMNWSSSPLPNIQVNINGINQGSPQTANSSSCIWEQRFIDWNSGTNTTAVLSLIDTCTGYIGNDLGIDDLFFGKKFSLSDSILVTIKPNCDTSIKCTNASKTTYKKCSNNPINLQVRKGSNYIWSPNIDLSNNTIQNPINTSKSSITYLVLYDDTSGCQVLDTIVVNVLKNKVYFPISDTLICSGDSAQLTIPIYASNITWSPNTNISDIHSKSPWFYPTSKTTYYLSFLDTFGCLVNDTITIDVKPCCIARARFDLSKELLCFGDFLSIINQSKNALTYKWNFGSAIPNSYNAPNPPPIGFNTEGAYNIQLIVSNNICFDTLTKKVYIIKLSPNAGLDSFNDCQSTISVNLGESPISDWTYNWNPAIYLNDPTIANPICNLVNDSIQYVLTVKDNSTGCIAKDSVILAITKSVKKVFQKLKICKGDSVLFYGKYIKNAGTYYNTIKKSGQNCDSILLEVNLSIDTPKSVVLPTIYACELFKDSKGKVYTNDTVLSDSIKKSIAPFCDSLFIKYDVKILKRKIVRTTVRGCDPMKYNGINYSKSINGLDTLYTKNSTQSCDSLVNIVDLIVYPKPKASITADKPNPVRYRDTVTLTASGGTSYFWFTNGPYSSKVSHYMDRPDEITYTVKVSNSFGCLDTTEYKIIGYIPDTCYIGVPNVFSPNGDSKNDIFIPNLDYCAEIISFKIFDRWGEKVFETNQLKGWDGNFKGKPAPLDVYIFTLEVKTPKGIIEKSGSFTLIR